MRHELLNQVIDFVRLLALASALAEDHVAAHIIVVVDVFLVLSQEQVPLRPPDKSLWRAASRNRGLWQSCR